MLRLNLSKAADSFRSELRAWLSANPPPPADEPGGNALKKFIDRGRGWQKKLSQGRWVAVHWPEQYGGRGLSLMEEAIVQEELTRVRAPQLLGLFGLTMVGPVLIRHGTEEQRSRFLSKILSADEIWCQGFSEPSAGSDLAAITTRAAMDERGFYITGQKVWTSFAHIADWCFLLCRTSDEKKKHEGLSYLLVPMKTSGITTRPLKQISGDEEFNEVFFDNVFVPRDHIVGKVGEGWKIAISTLMYERVVLTFARQLQSEVALREMIGAFRSGKLKAGTGELAALVVKSCAVRALSYRHLSGYVDGKAPGPEGSLDKLFWSETFQEISELGFRALGSDGARNEGDRACGETIHRYLYSLGRTIAAGTSEIQRNIIAERLLGLPRARGSA